MHGDRTAVRLTAGHGSLGAWCNVLIDFPASILTEPASSAGRASQEMDSSKNHMIVEDGYNRGRNYIVERATRGSHWRGMWWKAEVQWQDGLLERGKRGPYSSDSLFWRAFD